MIVFTYHVIRMSLAISDLACFYLNELVKLVDFVGARTNINTELLHLSTFPVPGRRTFPPDMPPLSAVVHHGNNITNVLSAMLIRSGSV